MCATGHYKHDKLVVWSVFPSFLLGFMNSLFVSILLSSIVVAPWLVDLPNRVASMKHLGAAY